MQCTYSSELVTFVRSLTHLVNLIFNDVSFTTVEQGAGLHSGRLITFFRVRRVR
jgi:hypothetical protein